MSWLQFLLDQYETYKIRVNSLQYLRDSVEDKGVQSPANVSQRFMALDIGHLMYMYLNPPSVSPTSPHFTLCCVLGLGLIYKLPAKP